MDRLKHVWEVPIQFESGQSETVTVASYWDPTQAGTPPAIETAAVVETRRETGRNCNGIG